MYQHKLIHTCHVLIMSVMTMMQGSLHAQDTLKNRAELSLPLTGKKLVIAHCMTNIMRYKGHPFEDGCNPDYYPVNDPVTGAIGGMSQVKVLEDDWLKDASLEEAVSFEMHTAMKSGIDGFQFYYILGNESWDEIIKAYFRVADREHLGFKLTLCISHPAKGKEEDKIASFAKRINNILDAVGRNNEHWLRTPDGRLILYTWYGEQIADIPSDKQGKSDAFYAARAFQKLAGAVHERFACIYLINENISSKKLDEYLDYFPAVWIWTFTYDRKYIGREIAEACKKKRRTLTGSAFPDFYTSKVLAPGTWNILSAQHAAQAGIQQIERKAMVTGLSLNFRKLLEFAIEQDVPIINIITWNDYPEGHHLAPEVTHNDGFSILLKHYKSIWKHEQPFYHDDDIAIVFFKQYKSNIQPAPYNVPLVYFQKGIDKPSIDDAIEVVTILSAPATVAINGNKNIDVPAGLTATRFPQETGKISVSINRNDHGIIRFTTPVAITDHPQRTNRLTFSFSNQTQDYYKEITGKTFPLFTAYDQKTDMRQSHAAGSE